MTRFTILLASYFIIHSAVAQKTVLHFEISPISEKNSPRLQVKMTFPANENGQTELRMPPDFGNADHLFRGIKNFRLLEKTGRFEWAADSSKITIRHRPEGTVGLIYEIAQDWPGREITSKLGFRPVIQPSFFHLFGNSLLLLPTGKEVLNVHLKWTEFPPKWLIHNSFGSQENVQSFETEAQKIRESVFVGGDFRVLRSEVRGQAIYTAVRGKWAFSDETLTATIREAVEMQREFWQDFELPFYTITLIPLRENSVKNTYRPGEIDLEYLGTGLTNSFAAYATNNPTVGIENLHHLFHHELMHDWIGGKIRNGGSDPNDMTFAWFSEGFTEYLAYKNLFKAGLLSADDFLYTLNEDFFQKHWQSPVATEPNSLIKQQFFTDNNVQELPYKRGFIFAFWLDNAIKKHSKNKASIRDFMLFLLKNYGAGKIGVSEDFSLFIKKASEFAGRDIGHFYQLKIIEGQQINVDEFILPNYWSINAQADNVPFFEAVGDNWAELFLK